MLHGVVGVGVVGLLAVLPRVCELGVGPVLLQPPPDLLVGGLRLRVLGLGDSAHGRQLVGDGLGKNSLGRLLVQHLVVVHPVQSHPLVLELHEQHLVLRWLLGVDGYWVSIEVRCWGRLIWKSS